MFHQKKEKKEKEIKMKKQKDRLKATSSAPLVGGQNCGDFFTVHDVSKELQEGLGSNDAEICRLYCDVVVSGVPARDESMEDESLTVEERMDYL